MSIDKFIIEESDRESVVEQKFYNYVEELLKCYVFDINGKKYELFDVECYWKSKIFPDGEFAYKRKNKRAGDIYFHKSGFDICFESNENSYGGILVRGIREVDNVENVILGPINVRTKLRIGKDYADAKLIRYKERNCEIAKTYRIRIKSLKKYRYVNFSNNIKGIKQKEIIADDIKERFSIEKAIKFLGYKRSNWN